MNLLIPISYFFGTPRSEIWQINTEKKSQQKIWALPPSHLEVGGKGITGIQWLDNNTLVTCDFNRLLKFKKNDAKWEIVKVEMNDAFNDLHSLSIANQKILLANTGRDSIDVFDFELNLLERHSAISDREFEKRVAGNYQVSSSYYTDPFLGISFIRRKVPDLFHFNHILQSKRLGNKLIATSFTKKCLIDIKTLNVVSNILPYHPHDGIIHDNAFWLTTVNGGLYRSNLHLPLHFELVLNLFKQSPHQGWCRGLLFAENKIFIGITGLYEESDRTKWLTQDINETKTGIYQVDASNLNIEYFYDLSHENGSKVFSILKGTSKK